MSCEFENGKRLLLSKSEAAMTELALPKIVENYRIIICRYWLEYIQTFTIKYDNVLEYTTSLV